MNQEMIEKLENMVAGGKITLEQKEELIKAMEEPIREDVSAELSVQLISEDLTIIGKSDLAQVEIIKGYELIEMTKTGSSMQIQSKKENGGFVDHLINRQAGEVVISVPSTMSIRLKTVSGDMQIQNLERYIQAKSVSGDISLTTHNNRGSLHSISGDIHIQDMKGELETTSKSGDIHIKDSNIQGEAKTYSGDIRIEQSKLTNMEISVFSGDIEMDQTTLNQGIACKTFSGDISLDLTNTSGYVKGLTSSGEMKVITAEKTNINLANQDYGDPGHSLQIQLKTLSGDAKISFTKEE